jgi:fermentation-respiration switch protein FrsA (DUF1100 family)
MSDLPRGRRWKIVARLLLLLVTLYLVLRWFEHYQIYHPYQAWAADGRALGRAWEDVSFTAADGTRLSGWFFPANTNAVRARVVIVVCHGNAGNISHRLGLYAVLLEAGVNVLAFDYRGYGHSAGRPSEEGTCLDAQAAHSWLRQRGYASTNLVAYGESLGGAVATELALRAPLGGLVLQSTFTSIPDLGAELFPWLPVRTLSTIKYDTRSKLPRVRVPVLILHSRRDGLVSFHHAERNFAVANPPKWLVEIDGDHNDSLEFNRAKIIVGLERLPALRTGPAQDTR